MTNSPDPEHWALVERLFSAALELPPATRNEFLNRECGEHSELKAEILALLDSAGSSEDYLLGLAARAGARAPQREELGRLAGKRLGSWRLVELIGRGGMGVVYLAERDDEQFRMKAALKILPLGVSSEEHRRRFLSERQILARLNHPNIARILDGGVTEDGTPFYVMEHVEGTPIDAYCDEHRLTLDQRLLLFEGVCKATENAHRNLIVHQDLKPGNILVTEEGQVKLLDFGIARILESEDEANRELTGIRGGAMTLSYASPEQVRREPVSTASDIYSLGLILYELLSGRHPYRHKIGGPDQAVSVITDSIPAPPSGATAEWVPDGAPEEFSGASPEVLADQRSTTLPRLKRALAGDLDTIILMALRKEPERRYASVSDFLMDLRNYRLKRPVSARPNSFGYRSSRFIQRNRVAASLSSVALLFLFGMVFLSMRSAATERAQARVIAQEAARAAAVTDFLVGLFEFTEAPDGFADTIRARTLVDRGADRIIESLEGQEDTKVQILGALARVYGNLGLPDREIGLLEEALGILRAENPQDELLLAGYLRRLAGAHRAAQDFLAADANYREAFELFRRNRTEPLALARALVGFAANYAALERPDSGLLMNGEAIQILRREEGGRALATLRALSDRAMIFRAAEEPDSAMAIYQEILPALREKADSGRYLLSTTLNNMGYLFRTQGELTRTRAAYREALPVERDLNLPVRLLTLLSNLAAVEENLGNLEETEKLLLERLDLAQKAWPQGHWRVGGAEKSVVRFLLGNGRPEEALPHARNELESYREQIGEDHAWTNEARVTLGVCLLALDRYREAEPYLLAGFEAYQTFGGLEHPQTQELIRRLVTLYEGWGRTAEADRFRGLLIPSSGGDTTS